MCYACNLGLKKTFSAYLPCFDEIEIASKVIGGARNRAESGRLLKYLFLESGKRWKSADFRASGKMWVFLFCNGNKGWNEILE